MTKFQLCSLFLAYCAGDVTFRDESLSLQFQYTAKTPGVKTSISDIHGFLTASYASAGVTGLLVIEVIQASPSIKLRICQNAFYRIVAGKTDRVLGSLLFSEIFEKAEGSVFVIETSVGVAPFVAPTTTAAPTAAKVNVVLSEEKSADFEKMLIEEIKRIGVGEFGMPGFIAEIIRFDSMVARLETSELHKAAYKLIPQVVMQSVLVAKESNADGDDAFMIVLSWFSEDYFEWVTISNETVADLTYTGLSKDAGLLKGILGQYKKRNRDCGRFQEFARPLDLMKQLEAHRGRCQECASIFYMICRALGFNVRMVFTHRAHDSITWVEYWSNSQQRWIHVDASGLNAPSFDNPSIVGKTWWGDRKEYIVFALGREGLTDVTRRYVNNPDETYHTLLTSEGLRKDKLELLVQLHNKIWLNCLAKVTGNSYDVLEDSFVRRRISDENDLSKKDSKDGIHPLD